MAYGAAKTTLVFAGNSSRRRGTQSKNATLGNQRMENEGNRGITFRKWRKPRRHDSRSSTNCSDVPFGITHVWGMWMDGNAVGLSRAQPCSHRFVCQMWRRFAGPHKSGDLEQHHRLRQTPAAALHPDWGHEHQPIGACSQQLAGTHGGGHTGHWKRNHFARSKTSRQIAAITQIHTDWEVPCRPHSMLVVKYFQTTMEKAHPQVLKYPAIPKLVAPSWSWEQCKFPVRHIEFLGKEIGQTELTYADWAQQAEVYVLQNMENPQKGRGRVVHIKEKPLVDPIKPWTWKRGGMAFWGQWISILTAFQMSSYRDPFRRKRLEQLQWVMHKHWQGEEELQLFVDLFQRFLITFDDDEYFVLFQHSLQQEKQAKESVLSEETEQYREWLQQGYTRNLRSLFKVLKRDEAPFLRPFQTVSVEERQSMRLKQWKEIWNCQEQELHLPMLEEICSRGRARANQLPPLHPGHMQKLAKRLPQKASGIDGISNDLLRNLPYEGFEKLAQMLMTYEKEGVIPQQWQANLVVLIPKNEQIERPIALVSTVYRLWCKMRAEELRTWQQELDSLMPWERAKPGCQVLHIALKRLLQAEVMTANQKCVVSVLCDLSNFYDRISLTRLSERCAIFATQLYTSARYLEGENITQGPVFATNGILAGDPQAPQVAKVYLHRSMQIFQQRFPEAKADLWIDDISFDIGRRPKDSCKQSVPSLPFPEGNPAGRWLTHFHWQSRFLGQQQAHQNGAEEAFDGRRPCHSRCNERPGMWFSRRAFEKNQSS